MNVSVIMPNHNGAGTISQAVSSVIDDGSVGEVIVYDDASTDGSLEALGKIAHPKLRVIAGTSNVGASGARQAAIAQAAFPILCFLDSDDFLSEGAVTHAAHHLVEHELDLSPFELWFVDVDGSNPRPFIKPDKTPMDGQSAFGLTVSEWSMHSMGVFRSEVYERAMESFEFHGYSDDELIGRRMLLESKRVAGNGARYYYRKQVREQGPIQRLGMVETRIEVIRLALDQFGPTASVRRARNDVALGLAVLFKESLQSRLRTAEVATAFRRYADLHVPWRGEDWKARLATIVTSAGLSLWRRGHPHV